MGLSVMLRQVPLETLEFHLTLSPSKGQFASPEGDFS